MHWEDLKNRGQLFALNESRILSKIHYEHQNAYPGLNIADGEEIRNPLSSYIEHDGIKLVILDNIYSLVIGLDLTFEREWSPSIAFSENFSLDLI
jgi:hypothetical protein